ncbi:hypothetical protein CYMTET_56805 [Cymbomonas tetramitiformis]|uniref:Uncharacterized protein n=1 Tax=Cymbomonas tetramitiformis TaxID=36881 RepID=A0AAE0EM74_9CHLO|nr:hypothetical protein CYMTET_56805 [Cymbomonas tetramitiformis]|eukprot:gene14843-17547_t
MKPTDPPAKIEMTTGRPKTLMERAKYKVETFDAKKFCLKYFCEGQVLDKSATLQLEAIDDNAPAWKKILVKHRRPIGMAIPITIFWTVWLIIMATYNYWYVFQDKYWMSLTMIFGSMFAGATSEGGAAVAFPVMTLVGDVKPAVARDFSFMIQSCGMTAASFTILWMRVQLEWNALIICSIGGLVGIITGLEEIAPKFDPPEKKITFVCVWFAFAVSLYYINRLHGRKTYPTIMEMRWWKGLLLLTAGVCGGIFSSIAGSGIDICSFAVLTLYFRVSEKTATPTSVILMAVNTVIGYLYRDFGMNPGVSMEAREYLYACMPIVVVGAPLGSLVGSHFHRLTLAWIVYIIDVVQLIGAYVLVDFTMHPCLPWAGVIIICIGGGVFTALASYGQNHQMDYEYRLAIAKGEIEPEKVDTKDPGPPGEQVKSFFKKYFMEGQQLTASAEKQNEDIAPDANFIQKLLVTHRRPVGIFIPMILMWIIWFSIMGTYNYWYVFKEKFWMSITMVFGSMFAGATSEGGAAIAFPVMTLVGGVKPAVARDFSFMIQSCGMTAASFTIMWMRVQIEWNSIIFCTIGGVIGMINGLEYIAPKLDPPEKKIAFVCTWFAFACSLYWLNRFHDRKTHPEIRFMATWAEKLTSWRSLALLTAGCVGGIFSAMTGSGIDICSFAVLTLLFRVSEKVATPTSVVLMAINTVIGYLYRDFGMSEISFEAREYLYACMPIVVVGAPLGSMVGSHLHRLTLAWIVYFIDTLQLAGAYALVDFSNHECLPYIGGCVIFFGWIFFTALAQSGEWLLAEEQAIIKQTEEEVVDILFDDAEMIAGRRSFDGRELTFDQTQGDSKTIISPDEVSVRMTGSAYATLDNENHTTAIKEPEIAL